MAAQILADCLFRLQNGRSETPDLAGADLGGIVQDTLRPRVPALQRRRPKPVYRTDDPHRLLRCEHHRQMPRLFRPHDVVQPAD